MTRQEKRDAWKRIGTWALIYTCMLLVAIAMGVEGWN